MSNGLDFVLQVHKSHTCKGLEERQDENPANKKDRLRKEFESGKKNILLGNLFIYNKRNNVFKGTGFMGLQKQKPLPEGIKTNSLTDDQEKQTFITRIANLGPNSLLLL